MGAWRQRFENWVMRGQRPASEPVRLTRRRIYILPTAQGYAFATLLFLLFYRLLFSASTNGSMSLMLTGTLERFILAPAARIFRLARARSCR